MLDLSRWRADPIAFIEECLVDPDTGKAFVLTDAQRDFLKLAFTLDAMGRLKHPAMVWSQIKKSGKTTFAAIIVITMILLFGGRNALGICAANDLEQSSGRVFARIVAIIKASPLLKNEATITVNKIVFKNVYDATIIAIASDAGGAAGANPTIVSIDELWAFTTERSRRLWDELAISPARTISARLVTSYAGYHGESELLEDICKHGMALPEVAPNLRAGNGMLFHWSHVPLSPWQTPEWLAQMRRDNRPSAFMRMYENKFVSDKSAFVDMDKWDQCVHDELHPSHERQSIWIGIDASSKRDSTALVAVTYNKNTNPHTVRLIQHKVFTPPIDFEVIERVILDWHRMFIIRKAYVDPSQMVAMAQRLKKAGIPIKEFVQTPANITEATTNLFDLINAKTLLLYRDEAMRLAASRAVTVESSRGQRIDKTKAAHHVDVVVALAMAALAAVKGQAEGISCTDPIWSAAWGNSPDDPDGTGAWHMARFMDHIRKFG
jgi:phage terminase large subunit-like protein